MSIVVIRIRNSGSYDIDPEDFHTPLSFTFGGRVVWNARVSEASTEELREKLWKSLRFFATEGAQPPRDSLDTVRRRLYGRMSRLLRASPEQDPAEPNWYGVRIEGLSLKRKEKAKLVVVLREPVSLKDDGVTKGFGYGGKLKDTGLIKDEGEPRRVTLPRVSGVLAIGLASILVMNLLSRPADSTIACSSGDLRIEGSSVLMSTMRAIADEYVKACGDGVRITTKANGSLEGVRTVVESDPANADGVIALSDTRSHQHDQLYAQKLAIVVYYVVVNSGVELTTLSVEDLRKISDGTWKTWDQVPGAGERSLPIRIVGRGQNSGTRQIFEQRVLGGGESSLSSDECLVKDRNPKAPVIRCERDDNAQVIQMISTIPGAIGYADALSTTEARRANRITALTLDGKPFDVSTAIESGYPFWTVEYIYIKSKPAPDSLTAHFLDFVLKHERARIRLTESGFRPCMRPQGPLELCNLR
ncbi:substrate-binding domain-containing protein [Streptosporangium sp. NPDC051023]|uniref:PstS family phosphate ABC transporter substrate-binding protein n=1 Tax=Streptosporangium sp. NPDC051023 TaxID=3155410 RepID=UPI003450C951